MRTTPLAVFSMLLGNHASAQPPNAPYGPSMMWDGWWFGMMMGPLMMILFVAVVVVLAVVAIRWLGGGAHRVHEAHQPLGKTPLDILKERFARGEIDKDEFEEHRRLLQDD